jgi:hypothetical protein
MNTIPENTELILAREEDPANSNWAPGWEEGRLSK